MSSQRRIRPFFKLSRMLLLIAALLICTVPAIAAAEEAVSGVKVAPCKELKPFNNIDELLYQFYVNLESDCLFYMPVEELEKVWGIKILDEERVKPDESYPQLRKSIDFEGKPYKTEKDAFYLKIGKNNNTMKKWFAVKITKKYHEEHATLFPDGNYPKLIPNPIQEQQPYFLIPSAPGPYDLPPLRPKISGKYNLAFNSYYWISSDQVRQITLEGLYGVTTITIGYTN